MSGLKQKITNSLAAALLLAESAGLAMASETKKQAGQDLCVILDQGSVHNYQRKEWNDGHLYLKGHSSAKAIQSFGTQSKVFSGEEIRAAVRLLRSVNSPIAGSPENDTYTRELAGNGLFGQTKSGNNKAVWDRMNGSGTRGNSQVVELSYSKFPCPNMTLADKACSDGNYLHISGDLKVQANISNKGGYVVDVRIPVKELKAAGIDANQVISGNASQKRMLAGFMEEIYARRPFNVLETKYNLNGANSVAGIERSGDKSHINASTVAYSVVAGLIKEAAGTSKQSFAYQIVKGPVTCR